MVKAGKRLEIGVEMKGKRRRAEWKGKGGGEKKNMNFFYKKIA